MSAPTAHLSVPMVVAFHHAGTVTLTMTVGMRKEEQALMNVTVQGPTALQVSFAVQIRDAFQKRGNVILTMTAMTTQMK